MKVQLRTISDKNIKKVNQEIIAEGYKHEVFNGVVYGAFISFEQLEEDARFMNEDAEGLKQQPDWKRPITPEKLSQFFWMKPGTFNMKLSPGLSEEDYNQCIAVAYWCKSFPNRINQNESSNFSLETVKKYYRS